MEVTVKIKKDKDILYLPEYATEFSAGIDLRASRLDKVYSGQKEVPLEKLKYSLEKGYFSLRGFERAVVGTGFYLEIPEGYVLDIRSRSGNAAKKGLIVANSPGTIDPDYRGEVMVILFNATKYLCRITLGDAIAQAVLIPFSRIMWNHVDELSETARGTGGLGSTGV